MPVQLNLEDTATAFAHLRKKELRRAHFLFLSFRYPWMVRLGQFFILWAFRLRLPVAFLVKKTAFRQFCGGEDIKECRRTIDHLQKFGVGAILDYSVEGKGGEEDFESTVQETLRTIKEAHRNPGIPFAVFKVSGLADLHRMCKGRKPDPLHGKHNMDITGDPQWPALKERVQKICQTAHEQGVRVFIDAEESWIQDPVDLLAHDMMRQFNTQKPIVYNTIQLYRHDRLKFLQEHMALAQKEGFVPGYKLVRGAYMEKERERALRLGYASPIHAHKQAVDKDFDAALELCLHAAQPVAICAGTHNQESTERLARAMDQKGWKRNDERVYFAQLYGMSDHLSFNLSRAGYNAAKYVPYGPVREVLPYLFRRAQENTAMAGQAGRELQLLRRELRRRRKRHK